MRIVKRKYKYKTSNRKKTYLRKSLNCNITTKQDYTKIVRILSNQNYYLYVSG